jgi:hypothetical protein
MYSLPTSDKHYFLPFTTIDSASIRHFIVCDYNTLKEEKPHGIPTVEIIIKELTIRL